MARPRSINLIFSLLLWSLPLIAESNLSCQETEVKSHNLKKSEKVSLCTLRDPSYFISKNCQDLSCRFMTKLKGKKLKHNSAIRPGMAICKGLNGVVEEVSLEKISYPVQRCVFPRDKTFVSLNLLESWDGKKFTGPSRPIDL